MINNRSCFFNFIFFYLPIILWMGFVFYLSSIPGLKLGAESISVEFFLRKLAHISEYFILTFLFWRIVNLHYKLSTIKAGIFSLALCLLYATSDEIHQSFVQDRSGNVFDILIDGIGGSFFAIFIILSSKIKKNK